MFDRIFGEYLLNEGAINKAQLDECNQNAQNARARLGTIAVAEQMITQAQADELNFLQSTTDKRFGDLAVEKGYLTDEQVGRLLKKQGNAFLVFIQSLIDTGVMNLEQTDEYVEKYRVSVGLSHSELDDLTSGDIDRSVSIFMPEQNAMTEQFCALIVRTLRRLIDNKAYIRPGEICTEISAGKGAMQTMSGDHRFSTLFIGEGSSLLGIAEEFAKEKFETVDLDALDAVAEFINCVDGLYATQLSQDMVDVDMEPPSFYAEGLKISGGEFLVVPIVVNDLEAKLVISIDTDIKVENA